ncbi:MAG: DUF1801 domain-containing protein [Acidimicrobiia bacterium]
MASEDVDNLLATLPDEKRKALERLRSTIKAAAPDAEELISYGVPSFRYQGSLVSYAVRRRQQPPFFFRAKSGGDGGP